MTAMIFAAGLGTRLKPLTDTMPKALVPVHGQPLLAYQIDKLKRAGINDIIVNVHHFPDMIIDYLRENDNFGCNIHISDEREQLLDTGGGLLKAWSTFASNEPILAINVDIVSDINFQDVINQSQILNPKSKISNIKSKILALLIVKSRETQRYLCFDENNNLCGWMNIATGETRPSNFKSPISNLQSPISNLQSQISNIKSLAFSGMQLLSPAALPLLQAYNSSLSEASSLSERSSRLNPSFNKFSIIDFYLYVVEHHLGDLRALEIDVPLLDVGKISQLSQLSTFNF